MENRMDEQIKKRAVEKAEEYKKSQQPANGRFLHFTKPGDWQKHQQQVAEAQKAGAPF